MMIQKIKKEYMKDMLVVLDYEIFSNGTKITRVKQDNYNIISNDEYCHIQGNSRETIDKGVRIRVNGV